MPLRWREIVIATLATCVAATSAGATSSQRREVLRLEGPHSAVNVALAGREILYSPVSGDPPAVYSVSGGRSAVIYKAPVVPLPRRFRKPSIYESRVSQGLRSLVGAPGVVAFVRFVIVTHNPKCRPQCGLPSYFTPLFYEVRARVGSGPFRRLAGGPGRCPVGQFWPEDVAVTQTHVVYSGRLDGCTGRRQEIRVGEVRVRGEVPRRMVLARFRRTGDVRVAAAGRFVAWTRDWSSSRRPELHSDALVVYDRARSRIAYTVEIPPKPRISGIYSLAVQSDGKVAAELGRDVGQCELPQLVWSGPSNAPRLRVFRGQPNVGFSTDVELVGDRVLFVRNTRSGCMSNSEAELVLASLDSSAIRVLGRYTLSQVPQIFPGPTFGFDGARSVFSEGALSEDRKQGWTSILLDNGR